MLLLTLELGMRRIYVFLITLPTNAPDMAPGSNVAPDGVDY